MNDLSKIGASCVGPSADQAAIPIVLLVDDELDFCLMGRAYFESKACRVLVAADQADAMRLINLYPIDAVVSDILLRDGNALELLTQMRVQCGEDLVFFFLTGCEGHYLDEAAALNPTGIFAKPCDWDDLIAATLGAIRK